MEPVFLQVADEELMSLSCSSYDEEAPNVPAIASLTALTRLELEGYKCTSEAAPRQSLGLKEVALLVLGSPQG